MNYLRTHRVNGFYAYRDWNGEWNIIDSRTGDYTGRTFPTRQQAVADMQATPRR